MLMPYRLLPEVGPSLWVNNMAKIKIKHPNEKRLEEALENLGKKKKPKKNPSKQITIPSSHRKVRIGDGKDKG